jgi:hypothetical protein
MNPRSQHDEVVASLPAFVWSVGEEGSDPIVLRDGEPFRHDQYAQSGHYDRMDDDLADVAALGVEIVRYGMPWRLAEPEPGVYDWRLWDRAFAACERAGVEPIVDLLHFGLPDHHPRFADPAWVDGFVRYVDAFVARYPEPRLVTPINEPGITALSTARYGAWNDRLASEADHACVLALVVLANLEALARFRADRPTAWIGSEGFTAHSPDSGTPEQIARRREQGWLVWDLHLGRDPLPAGARMLEHVDDAVLERIAALAVDDGLIAGHDLYPVSVRTAPGADPAVEELVAIGRDELALWHDRYDVPFWIAETSNLGLHLDEQITWLDTLTGACRSLRDEGRPVRGLCWYSRGDQFDWQTMLTEPTGAVTEVGLFDTERRPRAVAARFAELAGGA